MKLGTHIDQFHYVKDSQLYDFLSELKLIDMEAKHITSITTEKARMVLRLAELAGHEYCYLGSHRESPSMEKEVSIIESMSSSESFNRPIRVVITADNRVWSDNNHSTIAYVKRFGQGAKLKDIPYYIADFRQEVPIIVSVKDSVCDSVVHIQNAIASAERLNDRLKRGYRPSNFAWSIGELINQLTFEEGLKL